MPFPLIAVAAGAAARALPMIAGAVGRGAATGAARMGASEGVAGIVGKGAESGTKMAAFNAMTPKESRSASFSQGAVSAQAGMPSGVPFGPDSMGIG